MKTHLNFHNKHSDILDVEKIIYIFAIYTAVFLMLNINYNWHENPFKIV